MRRSVLFLFVLSLAACGDDGTPVRTCATSAECAPDETCVDDRCVPRTGGTDAGTDVGRDTTPPATLDSVRLDPPMAMLNASLGERPTQAFTLVGVFSDGEERPVTAPRFSLAELAIGDIDEASGAFTANGVVGGTTTVTAAVDAAGGALEATATISVIYTSEILGDGVPADVETRFATPVADDARRAQLAYPLDGVVMPQNVFPADVQWLLGAAGDVFRVEMTKPHFTLTAFVLHSGAGFGNHWLVDAASWRALAQTDPDDPASLRVDRWEAASGEAVSGTAVGMTFARAALTGSVYYWDIQRGRIVRIDDGTAMPNDFMPNPPAANDGNRCVGCHVVSNSGRYMAGRLGGGENIGAVFDLTVDLTGDPPPVEFPIGPTSSRWWFASWSPDDTRLVVSQDEGGARSLGFLDPFTGAQIVPTGTMPTNVTHPAWSPDGAQIAYVGNVNQWGGAFTAGDIFTLDVTGPDVVGANRAIHTGASLAASSPAGVADSYPTWTPDSARIAFSHGSGTRSEDQQAALYMMNRDGTNVVRLDRTNGGDTTNFQPRFSPFDQGGFFWVSFLSRRDYGNAEVGTRGAALQQIWVAAIRKDAGDGEDPGAVPYWLAGQRTTSRNISAYWAPRPCRDDGESCTVGSECCGGDCRPGADGALVCSPPPPERCRMDGETCSTSADCCEGLECFGRVCIRPPG
ncbi:MAG: hypothetical protein AAGE52_24445 [Myxococcota bacterium]